MSGLAREQRLALCDTLTRVGPDAPTLCTGWSAADLAAHLVVRERRPDVLPGMAVPALARHTARVQNSYIERSWNQLVDLVRTGPPRWSPTRLPQVDDRVNLAEFFVHHEDVLRAQPDWEPSQIRELPEEVSEALWSTLRAMGQLLYRRADVGVTLVSPLLGRRTVHAQTKAGSTVVSGSPGELLLYSFGRKDAAQVELFGPAAALELLARLRLGF